MSPLLDPARNGEVGANVNRHEDDAGAFRGTDGSNSVPSREESTANSLLSPLPVILKARRLVDDHAEQDRAAAAARPDCSPRSRKTDLAAGG
jgi:hypothetical protein